MLEVASKLGLAEEALGAEGADVWSDLLMDLENVLLGHVVTVEPLVANGTLEQEWRKQYKNNLLEGTSERLTAC